MTDGDHHVCISMAGWLALGARGGRGELCGITYIPLVVIWEGETAWMVWLGYLTYCVCVYTHDAWWMVALLLPA